MRALDYFLKDARQVFVVVGAVDARHVFVGYLIRLTGLLAREPVRMRTEEILRSAAGIHPRQHDQSLLVGSVGEFAVKVAVSQKLRTMMKWNLAWVIGDNAASVYNYALYRCAFPELPPPRNVVADRIALGDIGLSPPDCAAIP